MHHFMKYKIFFIHVFLQNEVLFEIYWHARDSKSTFLGIEQLSYILSMLGINFYDLKNSKIFILNRESVIYVANGIRNMSLIFWKRIIAFALFIGPGIS